MMVEDINSVSGHYFRIPVTLVPYPKRIAVTLIPYPVSISS